MGWGLTPWIARLVIGIEIFLGILIILNFRLRGFTLRISFGLLFFFTIYLAVIFLTKGNREHCNCFGSFLILNPVESILKNIVLLVVTFILYRYQKGLDWDYPKLIVAVSLTIAMVLPFAMFPIASASSSVKNSGSGLKKLNLELLYSGSFYNKPARELRKGKHILAFLSLACPSCQMAAYKFHLIKQDNPAIPIYFILSGTINEIPRFLTETKTANIPHTLLLKQDFIKLIGMEVPVILYLDDGVIYREISFLEINQKDIEGWSNN